MDGEELHRPSPPALVHRTGLRQGQDLSTQQVTLHNRRASHNKTGMEWGSDMGLGTRLGNRDGLGTRLCRPSLVVSEFPGRSGIPAPAFDRSLSECLQGFLDLFLDCYLAEFSGCCA